MLVLGLAVAMSVQIVGALLVLTLCCHPGRGRACGHRLAGPAAVLLSVVFAVRPIVGGILLALGSSIPISPYVTTSRSPSTSSAA